MARHGTTYCIALGLAVPMQGMHWLLRVSRAMFITTALMVEVFRNRHFYCVHRQILVLTQLRRYQAQQYNGSMLMIAGSPVWVFSRRCDARRLCVLVRFPASCRAIL